MTYLLSDITPKNSGRVITVKSKKRHSKETNVLWASSNNGNPRLIEASMEVMADFIQAHGASLDEAVSKQLQCALLAIGKVSHQHLRLKNRLLGGFLRQICLF